MGIRYRDVAARMTQAAITEAFTSPDPKELGTLYKTTGKPFTEKELERLGKHGNKIIARFKKRIDRINSRDKVRTKKAKEKAQAQKAKVKVKKTAEKVAKKTKKKKVKRK